MLTKGKYPYSEAIPDELKERFMNWAYVFVETLNSRNPRHNFDVLWNSANKLQVELNNLPEYKTIVKSISKETIKIYVISGMFDKAGKLKEDQNYKEAVLFYQRILELDDKNVRAFMGISQCYFYLHLYAKAIENLNIVLYIRPDYPGAYCNLSLCYCETNHPEKAKEFAEKALSLQPSDPDYLSLVGCINHEIGNYDQALDNFKKALKITPDDEDIYRNIALVYHDCQQDELIAELYMKALIRKPELVKCFWEEDLILDLDITTELKYDLLTFGAEYGDKKARQCLDDKTWLE